MNPELSGTEATPEAVPVEATPEPEAAPEATPEPAPAPTFTLPDGREVDADTLQREWKENFLPDYTRKSQELAEYKKPPVKTDADLPPWKQPGYVPQSYDELIELGAQEALARLARTQAEEAEHRKAIETQVDTQLAELKKVDPKLDENALFQHASKYGFRDLKTAHENYRVMRDAVAQAEAEAVKNISARGNTPVAVPGATPPVSGDAVDPTVTQKFGSAREYLASLGK